MRLTVPLLLLIVMAGCNGLSEADVERIVDAKMAEKIKNDTPMFAPGEAATMVQALVTNKTIQVWQRGRYRVLSTAIEELQAGCGVHGLFTGDYIGDGVWHVTSTEGDASLKWTVYEHTQTIQSSEDNWVEGEYGNMTC